MRSILTLWLLICCTACADPDPVTAEVSPIPESPRDAAVWRHKTMVLADGTIPSGALRRALESRDQIALRESDNGGIQKGSWSWLGPGNAGGRCRSLWIQATNPRVMVLGSVGGGLWRTTDGGAGWVPVADYPASLAVGCMARPSKRSSLEIWVGTGETFTVVGLRGAGIYRSTDGGLTFQRLPSTANSNFTFVSRIAIHPTRPGIVLAATDQGLWRTVDFGVSWNEVLVNRKLDVKYDPSNGDRCICAGRGNASVFFSTDGGARWQSSAGFPIGTRRVELAYAPSDPDTVYASVEMSTGNSRVYRSQDGGRNFALRSATGILEGQGGYDNAIWVDPTDEDLIVVGGVRLYRSSNAGTSFTELKGLHADQHHIQEHPDYDGRNNRMVFVCNDGGIYRTSNILASRTPVTWTDLNNRLGITQFYGGAISAAGRAIGGTQDNGTQQVLSTVVKTARKVAGGDGMMCQADPKDFRYLYGEYQWADVFRTVDGGNSTQSIVNNMTDVGRNNAPWVGALCLDRNDADRLWLGSRNLWRTDNVKTSQASNVSWSMVHSFGQSISAVDVSHGRSSTVVTGSMGGRVYLSRNATLASPTWSQINKVPMPTRFVTSIKFNPRDADHIYVTMGGFADDNVWETRDAGVNWKNIGSSLPEVPVRTIAVHPRNEGWLYIGTTVGVFTTTDGGKNWTTDNEGPATVAVDELVISDDGTIHAFTFGRGIYKAHAGTSRDLGAGTTRASITWQDLEADDDSFDPTISGNGRYVAFASDATNLAFGDNNGRRDIFVRDRQEGTTSLISVSTSGLRNTSGSCDEPDISTDGRFVAFESTSTNLVSFDTNGQMDIFVRDRTMDITERVNVSSSGAQSNGISKRPSISADGRFVVFYSAGTTLVPGDTNSKIDVFRHDRATNQTVRVSVGPVNLQGDNHSVCTRECVSADGKFVVFHSSATNLVTNDNNGKSDVFLRDLSGLFVITRRISVPGSGGDANGHSYRPSISADGRYIAYSSDATNLVAGDNNGARDVFLYDRTLKTTTLLSVSTSGGPGNDHSMLPIISDDGQTIAFESHATNLVTNDINATRDVFVATINPLKVVRASVDSGGRQALNGQSRYGTPSADGRFICFESDATTLVNNDLNGRTDVFVFERDTASTVYPTDATNKNGSLRTSYPLQTTECRVQQSARETIGKTIGVKRIGFRRDESGFNTLGIARTIDLELSMGDCEIDNMIDRFASNWIGTPTVTIQRKQFNLPDWRAPSIISRFDVNLPFDQVYSHFGSHHLLWEMRVFDNSSSNSPALVDAHSNLISYSSTSTKIGSGCQTPNGEFGHTLLIDSDGAATPYTIGAQRGPANAPITLVLGVSNPNLTLSGFCTKIYTDAFVFAQIGTTDASGSYSQSFQGGPWDPTWRGLELFTQMWSPTGPPGGFLSHGRRIVLPTRDPGPAIRRLASTSNLAIVGVLQNLGAVFQLDY